MQTDLEALERKQAQYNSMDKRAGDLSKEVKTLQEGLADYNTVLDKVAGESRIAGNRGKPQRAVSDHALQCARRPATTETYAAFTCWYSTAGRTYLAPRPRPPSAPERSPLSLRARMHLQVFACDNHITSHHISP